ncbi:hypothetical protein CESP606_21195 [Cereibacter sphaeroides]|jgi:hypothetical protein|uniref:hypothetical protein n=1 Tax=Cereibacter sphaeroides TaxID=1063 RepID=UPI000A8FB923|nr:hypothetical protein [Cereibacter sphaeroides]GEM95442.1 hypothetical protein RSP03_45090 [Cereibacter sphaeroides]
MKNKGLLTRAGGSPLSFRKDPVPTDMPNRIAADASAAPVVAADQPEIARGETNPVGKAPRATPTPRRRQSPSSEDKAPRYTLRLTVEAKVLEELDRLLGDMDDKSRIAAKKALVRTFASQVAERTPKKAEYVPTDPVVYRIDLKIPDSLRAAILAVEGANPLEPAGTALSRNLAPVFAAFVRKLGK